MSHVCTNGSQHAHRDREHSRRARSILRFAKTERALARSELVLPPQDRSPVPTRDCMYLYYRSETIPEQGKEIQAPLHVNAFSKL